jgi:ATP-dependent DNA ligase
MSNIKSILDVISETSGNNAKVAELKRHLSNDLLKRVLYMACSRRVKFYIKQIPDYATPKGVMSLEDALDSLSVITSRELTGNSAVQHLSKLLSSVSEDDAYVIERIIDKSLKIGLGTTFINKVFKDLIEKTPYMGAISFNEEKVRKLFKGGAKCKSDIKMDGRYCNAIIQNGEVELVSRQGETTFVGDATFLKELSEFPDCVLNGELTIRGGIERYEANGIIASVVDIEGKREERGPIETSKKIDKFEKKHGSYEGNLKNIQFTVWDIITIDEYFNKKSTLPYKMRLTKLAIMPESELVTLVESKIVNSFEEAMEHFQEALKRGLEGTIVKSLEGGWKNGKPTTQIKMKLEITLDLVIKSFNYGTKGTKNEHVISSINVESQCGKLKTSPGGMDEAMMEYVTENMDKLVDTLVEIRCCGVSQNSDGEYSTLHPSVVKFRDDKAVGNTLNECIEIDNSAKGLI